MTEKIRVLLADDHPLIRAGISTVLQAAPHLTLVGDASSGEETRRLSRELQPDVLLLDLYMPGPPPLETVAWLRQHCPATKIIILTAYDDSAYVRSLMAAGVEGYILKDEATETVVSAIQIVADGNTLYSRSVLMKLAQEQERKTAVVPPASPVQNLSNREYQVLELVAQGWDNRRIADELQLAQQTIRNIVSRIYTKLEIKSRAEAVIWARERDLGKK